MKHATLRAGFYDDVHTQVEQLARDLEPHDYLAGTWLRELAIALAMNEDLVVSVVTYDRGGQELEVRLASAQSSDSLDLWVGIKDQPSVEHTVGLARALLSASASVGTS